MRRPLHNPDRPAVLSAVLSTVLSCVVLPLVGLGVSGGAPAAAASAKKPAAAKTREAPSTTTAESAFAVKQLVEATRTAGLRDAARFGVKLGNPVCPSGTKRSAGAVQCLVDLGKTTVAYLVRPTPTGVLQAYSTFPLIATVSVEAAVRAANPALTRIACSAGPFLVQPVNSVAVCKVNGNRSGTARVRVVSPDGELRVESTA